MTCRDVIEHVDAIAAAEYEADAAERAHLETCPRCAAALMAARRLEAALAARPAPQVPGQFTAAVLHRIRRDQWRVEERVDRLFNIGIAVAVFLMVGGVAALLNLGGVLSTAGAAWSLVAGAGIRIASGTAPTLNTYIAGAGLLLTALGMWWWAERKLSL